MSAVENADVFVATCAKLPALDADERRLLPALRARGLAAEPRVWSDPAVDWSAARCCVIRTTWDYTAHYDEYRAWLRRTAAATRLVNPLETVLWNTHKGYLEDLAERGVPVVPTVHLAAGAPVDLEEILARQGWDEFVLKPAVGATARAAVRLDRSGLARGRAHLDRLLAEGDALLQPFLASVLAEGEVSLVFLDGGLSHAVKKRAAPGDWRVQDDFGGTIETIAPSAADLAVAERTLDAVDLPWLYARVDLVAGMVIELELVEPALYFGYGDGAAERLATAIARLRP